MLLRWSWMAASSSTMVLAIDTATGQLTAVRFWP
jgi:hypothetical protein